MNITEAIVHGIEKESGETTTILHPRETQSTVDEHMNRLGNAILTAYGKVTNNYGSFGTQDLHRFPSYLTQYHQTQINLVDFSKAALSLISDRMASSAPSTGGYVLFARYTSQGRDWLLIVMLKLKTGTGIDKTTLELNSTVSFDIQHLHEAARIDIEKWQSNEQPYLSFIKKSGRQDDVTRYFRNALSCTDYIDSKHHTTQLLKAVDAYCSSNDWSAEQKQNARRRTYEYCNEKYELGEVVNVTSLSAMINDQEPDSFSSYILENQITLNETFSPHKATFTRFKRIQGRFNNIKISFDVDDVINETVDYDPASNSLIIKGIPESLIIDINRAKGNEPTTE